MEYVRTFIAIELSTAVCQAISNLQNRLKGVTPPHSVRWSAPQNIHLTLHFLGDIDQNQVGSVASAIAATATGHSPFEVLLGGLGCFPNVRRPRVLWVGLLERNEALTALQLELGDTLRNVIGFTPDARPYAPHLTLGRVKKGIPVRHLDQLSQVIQNEQRQVGPLARLEVTNVALFKSDLKPGGPVYTQLGTGHLAG